MTYGINEIVREGLKGALPVGTKLTGGWPSRESLEGLQRLVGASSPTGVLAHAVGIADYRGPELGEALRQLAERLEVNKSELARRASNSRAGLHKLFTGETWPQASTLETVARGLGFESARDMLRAAFEGAKS